jgi:hypothetical protein
MFGRLVWLCMVGGDGWLVGWLVGWWMWSKQGLSLNDALQVFLAVCLFDCLIASPRLRGRESSAGADNAASTACLPPSIPSSSALTLDFLTAGCAFLAAFIAQVCIR